MSALKKYIFKFHLPMRGRRYYFECLLTNFYVYAFTVAFIKVANMVKGLSVDNTRVIITLVIYVLYGWILTLNRLQIQSTGQRNAVSNLKIYAILIDLAPRTERK